MLNRVCIAGRMTADPELKRTQSSVAVTSFRLAVDRDFKDKSTGEKGTDFIPVVCWRHNAEFVSQYGAKGRMVIVDGRIQIREYTDSNGNKRSAFDIVADSVYFADSRKTKGSQDDQFTDLPDDDDYGIPF